jgi:hypothetical protein
MPGPMRLNSLIWVKAFTKVKSHALAASHVG